MKLEHIEVRDFKGEVIDLIPMLSPGRGRNVERRNKEIKENDLRLRMHFKAGMTVKIIEIDV